MQKRTVDPQRNREHHGREEYKVKERKIEQRERERGDERGQEQYSREREREWESEGQHVNTCFQMRASADHLQGGQTWMLKQNCRWEHVGNKGVCEC